jgi:hypothetical protein
MEIYHSHTFCLRHYNTLLIKKATLSNLLTTFYQYITSLFIKWIAMQFHYTTQRQSKSVIKTNKEYHFTVLHLLMLSLCFVLKAYGETVRLFIL